MANLFITISNNTLKNNTQWSLYLGPQGFSKIAVWLRLKLSLAPLTQMKDPLRSGRITHHHSTDVHFTTQWSHLHLPAVLFEVSSSLTDMITLKQGNCILSCTVFISSSGPMIYSSAFLNLISGFCEVPFVVLKEIRLTRLTWTKESQLSAY